MLAERFRHVIEEGGGGEGGAAVPTAQSRKEEGGQGGKRKGRETRRGVYREGREGDEEVMVKRHLPWPPQL